MPQHHHSIGYNFDDDEDLLKKRRKPPSKSAAGFLPPNSPRPSSRTFIILLLAAVCLLVGVAGITFAVTALRRPPRIVTVYRCGRTEDTLRTFQSKSLAAAGREESIAARPKVLGIVGVYTTFSAADRRAALRSTWFPSDPDALSRLDHATGLALRFVIGRTKDSKKMANLRSEIEMHHDFMLVDFDEDNLKLPNKTLAFFKAAFNLFDADFYVKTDDDIYLRPDRLATLLAKDRSQRFTYIGCMKKGPVVTDPNMKWYESLGNLIGNEYFLHAHGPIYAISADAVAALASFRNDSLRLFNSKSFSLRLFSNEDVTIGSWMLAMNINYEDNKALCEPLCTLTSIAVWSNPRCLDPCNLKDKLLELQNVSVCTNSSTLPPEEDDER